MFKKLLGLALILSAVSGCAVNKAEATLYPDQTLKGVDSIHVVKLAEDERGVDQLVVNKLESLGKTVTSGTKEESPEGVDAVVTYLDKWMWDITMYMIELTVVFSDAENDMPIAKGYSMHTSLTRLSPEEMVDEVITNIYNEEQ